MRWPSRTPVSWRPSITAISSPATPENYDYALQAWPLIYGTLLTTDNQIDQATGTIRLKAQFPNANEALFPNQFVNARLLVDTLRGVTVVPTVALQRSSQSTFVYVVKPDNTAA